MGLKSKANSGFFFFGMRMRKVSLRFSGIDAEFKKWRTD